MTDNRYAWEGMFKWAQVFHPSAKYKKYMVSFYPANETIRKEIRSLGTRNGMKEDDDGMFYIFYRPVVDRFGQELGPPKVTDEAGQPITALLGNGSKGLVVCTVNEWVSAQHGTGRQLVLEGLVIRELIEYKKEETTEKEATVPAQASRPKIPF